MARKWESYGKILRNAADEKFQLQPFMQPNTVFYPVHGTLWQSTFDATNAGDYDFFQKTRAVHLWNEMLRSNGFDKNGPYETGSLGEYYERKYVAEVPERPNLRIFRRETPSDVTRATPGANSFLAA